MQQYLVQRSRSRLMKQVIFLYFLTLLGLIFVTIKFGIPLEQGGGDVASPAPWLSIIKTYYYVIPVVLAFVFGLFFRPFWRNFRNLLVTIFLIHLFFSLVIYATRYGYLQKQHVDIARSKIAELKILDLKKVFIDENKDGVLDQIKVTISVDYNGFLEGHYALSALLTQGGQEFPQNSLGMTLFEVGEGPLKLAQIIFKSDPQVFKSLWGQGDFDIDLILQKKVFMDSKGKMILSVARWAPFFRYTSWGGADPKIHSDIVELNRFEGVDTFFLLPIKVDSALENQKNN